MTDKVDVVVLAGGKNSPEMEAATGVTNRALVALGDKTMLAYVMDALAGAAVRGARLRRRRRSRRTTRYQQIPGGDTLMDNLLAGLRAANADGEDRRVLVATSDTPFLTPDSVDYFIRREPAGRCRPLLPHRPD